jgi:hypothetical protein
MGVNSSVYFDRSAYPDVKGLFEDIQHRDRVSVVVVRQEPRP